MTQFSCIRVIGGRRSGARSVGRQMLEVTRCNTSLFWRPFIRCSAAQQVWNYSLPDSVRDFTVREDIFAKRLKSHLGRGAFDF